jgi:hypothetical protein
MPKYINYIETIKLCTTNNLIWLGADEAHIIKGDRTPRFQKSLPIFVVTRVDAK